MSFDINKPYRTRDGREAYATALPNGMFAGAYRALDDESWWTDIWDGNGRCTVSGNPSFDLVNIPEKRTVKVWINIYPDCGGGCYELRSEADRHALSGRIACIEREITYEVGEGL